MTAGNLQMLLAVGAGVSAVLLLVALFYPLIARRSRLPDRIGQITGETVLEPSTGTPKADVKRRRAAVEKSLREMAEKQRDKARQKNNPSLPIRMRQARLNWTVETYLLICALSGGAAFVLAYGFGLDLILALALAAGAALILPRSYVNMARARVMRRFVKEFPNAVDVIVRGIRSGLPLGECMEVISRQASEPVRSEFLNLVDDQKLGITVTDAVQRMADRMPVTEAAFFATVITMQSQTGGNLSEVLDNLSTVMREQAKMKAKIKAMSSEAKTSGGIIGSMPIIVGGLIYLTNPAYIELLFTTTTGNMVLIGSAIWMIIGVVVMRQMINFDF
jgi:tight adherence protein B